MNGSVSELSSTQDRFPRTMFAANAALFIFATLVFIWARRYLYGDGGYFLFQLLRYPHVFEWFPARYHSHLLTQWPIVVALRVFDCTNLTFLAGLFGSTILSVPVFGLLGSRFMSRRGPLDHLHWPVLCAGLLCLTTSFIAFHESWVTIALFWTVLAGLLNPAPLSWPRRVVLIAAAFFATRTFESYLFLAIPLAAAAIPRLVQSIRRREILNPITYTACLAINLLGVWQCIQELRAPFDPNNRDNFVQAITGHINDPLVQFTLAALAVYALILAGPNSRRWQLGMLALLGVAAVTILSMAIFGSCRIVAGRQYEARVQFLYVPWLLGMVAVGFRYGPEWIRRRLDERNVGSWQLTSLVMTTAVVFQLNALIAWRQSENALSHFVQQDLGVVEYQEALSRTGNDVACRDQFWGWSILPRSIVVGAMDRGKVSTVIDTPKTKGWQPFDARDTKNYEWFTRYGVTVDVPTREQEAE